MVGDRLKVLVIGLTGGIGSGKSTVASIFHKLGAPVIDADRIARELVAPGQAALDEITKLFGCAILTAEGELDRSRLRQIIFQDSSKKKALEDILHPRIRETIKDRISLLQEPYCIIEIPLLLETGQTDLVDRILVVDAPRKMQYDRVKSRNRLTEQEIEAIIASQTDRSSRLAAADDIIVNDKTLQELEQKVSRLHNSYLTRAANHRHE